MTAADDPYAALGTGYSVGRRPDPRVAELIDAARGDARTVLNVGAGTGSYEPRDRLVTAVEPSVTMIGQRPAAAAPVVRGVAERLPFADQSFDAALAILTVHHWADAPAGLAELRRVSRRQVVLTWDPEILARFWLVREYLPQVAEHEGRLAGLAAVTAGLAGGRELRTVVVPVPGDCTDGFLGAFWRRPRAYLDPAVRASMSGLALLDAEVVAAAHARLAADLVSGRWRERHRHLLSRPELDLGYRLVTARS
jgi:SAM-dependent methyltransferase